LSSHDSGSAKQKHGQDAGGQIPFHRITSVHFAFISIGLFNINCLTTIGFRLYRLIADGVNVGSLAEDKMTAIA